MVALFALLSTSHDTGWNFLMLSGEGALRPLLAHDTASQILVLSVKRLRVPVDLRGHLYRGFKTCNR